MRSGPERHSVKRNRWRVRAKRTVPQPDDINPRTVGDQGKRSVPQPKMGSVPLPRRILNREVEVQRCESVPKPGADDVGDLVVTTVPRARGS